MGGGYGDQLIPPTTPLGQKAAARNTKKEKKEEKTRGISHI
jgi:hypothetical protein